MSNSIFIEKYTDKSFIVKGDTTKFKENIKNMGGKWNSRLTDKNTGEKFGAWLFWLDKYDEIQNWINNGFQEVEQKKTDYKQEYNYQHKISILENRVSKLEKILETLINKQEDKQEDKQDIEDSDEENYKVPRRRLLK